MNTACLFTISAPSGAGKTSLVKALREKLQNSIAVSVSHSTRSIRPDETDGVDYHFIAPDSFEEMVRDDAFLEHAQVFDNYYGTARAAVEKFLASGKHVILEIDWQGARQVKKKLPETIGIFILPTSREVLEQRLIDRGTDDRKTIDSRMMEADNEMSHHGDAEYLVINQDFEKALYALECIIHAQSFTLSRQKAKNVALFDSIPKETV